MSIRIEHAGHVGHEFLRVGLDLAGTKPELFEDFVVQHVPNSRAIDEWKSFFSGEKRWIILPLTTTDKVAALLHAIVSDACNRPGTGFGRAGGPPHGPWVPVSGSFDRLPIVVSDDHVCHGCGKEHRDSIGWNLEVGPFEVPCCPGRGEFNVRKSCRFEAVEKISCCPICGDRRFETRAGRVCRDCLALVDEGEKARRTAARTEAVVPSADGVPYDLGKAFGSVLEAMGASRGQVRQPGSAFPREGLFVPELAASEIRAFLEMCGRDLVAAHAKGVREGSDLLFGLASGKVSVNDFNDRRG